MANAREAAYSMISNNSTVFPNFCSNCTFNNNSEKFPLTFPYLETTIFAVVFSTIGFIGVVGNSLVIVAIASDAKMRKSAMNVLLLNLALADLMNLIVCVPDITLRLMQLGWLLPEKLCPAFRYLEVCFLYTSLLTQVAVCIERCFAITLPMKIRLLCSRRKSIFWSLALWTTASIWAVPIAVWNVVLTDKKTGFVPRCVWRGNRRLIKIFRCAECVAFYFVPLILIGALYTKISLTLWNHNDTLQEKTTDSSDTNSGSYRRKIRNTSNSEPLRVRQNVVKMLIACICVYFACYSPIQAIFIAETFFNKTFSNPNIFMSLNCFTYACSACNPLMYSVFSQKFRQKFAEILQCKSRNRRPSYVPNNAVNCNNNSNLVNNQDEITSFVSQQKKSCGDLKQTNNNSNGYKKLQLLKQLSSTEK